MPRRPRNRGIQRKDERIGLTDKQLEHLIFGHTWIDDEYPFKSENHRQQCWFRHKDEIMAMMTDDEEVRGFRPYLLVGMRPQAWFDYEDVPKRTVTVAKFQPGNIKHPDGLEIENRDIQTTPDYLDKHGLWLMDEKRKYEQMRAAKERKFNKLRNVAELSDWQEMEGTSKKAKLEYED